MPSRDKVSNLIARRLRQETDTVFGVTGGYVVNLVDSFQKEGISVISMMHEQSASIAADAYARFNGFGVCFGTSGPGTTNLITGTACSYYDSIPVLTIGGQVPSKYLNRGRDRQFGFQETEGVKLMKPVTKLSRRMKSIGDLENAIEVAKEGRAGPTFLEITDDYQRSIGSDVQSRHFKKDDALTKFYSQAEINFQLSKAKKPLVIVGSGARKMPLELKVPFLYTWGMKDKLHNLPYCKGDFGVTGSPNGNRLTKESDLIVMIGTRMDNHQVPDWEDFAPQAYKIAIGLEFPHKAEVIETELNFPLKLKGRNWGRKEENKTEKPIYRWVDKLCENSDEGDVIIPDMGQTGCIVFQRWKPKKDQRLFNGMNHSPMGYSLPGAIGASLTGRKVISIVGDGSLMMNLQDLQTIGEYNLPVEIYVVNNGGYGMIRQTQKDWKQYLKQEVATNFDIPDIRKLRDAFGVNIREVRFKDTEIVPKWKWGEKL